MRFNTKAIHGGHGNDPQTGAVSFPVYQTSTYSQDVPGIPRLYQNRELSYGRSENPTRTALENSVAALEGGEYGIAFSSGLAAVNAVCQLLKAGDHVVAAKDLYGGAYRQFTQVVSRHGVQFSFVDTANLEAVEAAITPETALVWLETPSNPLLSITDINAVSAIARKHDLILLVDNTFATSVLQNPLVHGADLVLHSATKYINGHSDVISGLVVTNNSDLAKRLRFIQNAVGAIPAPWDCFLVLRGLKTLGLRMERHCSNASKIATFLDEHPRVTRVYYPGLVSHPGHEIAKKQMAAYGAIVSCEIEGGVEKAFRLLDSLRYFALAESLGGVKSLICHPPSMTHASMDEEARKRAGITPASIRISVGLEDVEDLIEDLDAALESIYLSGNGHSPTIWKKSSDQPQPVKGV